MTWQDGLVPAFGTKVETNNLILALRIQKL